MTLRFRYRSYVTPLPVVPLGGQQFRLRPVISAGVLGPTRTVPIDVLLDTGSDDTTFPEWIASTLGIDLTNAPTRYLTGIGPTGHRVRYANVRLRLSDGIEFRDWPAMVGFTDAPLVFATLGHAGCFQYFTVKFHGDIAEAELDINRTYPGT